MKFLSLSALFFACIFGLNQSSAQSDQWRVHIQLRANLGYPQNNIGCRLVGEYYYNSDMEFALAYDLTYHLSNYGPNTNHLEHSLMGTAQFVWGRQFDPSAEDLSFIKFLDSRRFRNSFGYTWQRYFNSIQTSQNVGTIHMRFNKTVAQFSNDVFANTNGKDRFRTGGFAFGYYEDKTLFMSRILIWTGDSHCQETKRIRDSDYPARWGYRDISECNYGRLSHGILSFGVIRDLDHGQTAGLQLGTDSEKVRNFIQNKVFHDMYFVPRFMNKTKNLHLPMKTANGDNYLYEEGQVVRPNKFVWQFSLNPSTMY